jgi:hypothetical protein
MFCGHRFNDRPLTIGGRLSVFMHPLVQLPQWLRLSTLGLTLSWKSMVANLQL